MPNPLAAGVGIVIPALNVAVGTTVGALALSFVAVVGTGAAIGYVVGRVLDDDDDDDDDDE